MIRISESLNLVVPIYGDDDAVVGYVHSIPLARSAFEANYRLVSATFAAIVNEGLGEMAGPRVAALILRDVAAVRKVDPEPLLNEIRRLSCLIRPGADGWETVPLHEAITRGQIDEDDLAEVLNALVFFTVESAMLPRKRAKDILPGAAKLWGAQTSSLAPTEWISSLQTSTATARSGETAPSDSPPPPPPAGITVTVMGTST